MACTKHQNCHKQHDCTRNEPEKHTASELEKGGVFVDSYPACHSRSGTHGSIHGELPEHAELIPQTKRAQPA